MQFLTIFTFIAIAGAATLSKKPSKYPGTWTYTSSVTTTTTVPTVTYITTPTIFDYTYVTVGPSPTETVTQYESTVYDFTTTVTASTSYVYTTSYVTATPTSKITSVVTVPTPKKFTPILSDAAYTDSVKIETATVTQTAGLTAEYSSYTKTVTSSGTITVPPPATAYVTVSGTFTQQTYTSYSVAALVETATLTQLAFPTQHAICNEDSGNYVDHFPFGADFGWTNYGDLTGDSVGWVRTHPVAGGTYLNQTSQVHDKVSCCNYAMSQGRAAGGFWMPADFFGRPRCYVFNVPDGDKQACQPDKVKYTLLSYPADRNFTGYYAFNGQCGRLSPDHHGYDYYGQPNAF